MKSILIAPCGMNCSICKGYLGEKNKCLGCNLMNKKSEYCKKCIIKNCKILKKNKWKFCTDKCEKYPCKRLKDLDKRYRTKYGMSMINNLKMIKDKGIREFLKQQKKKYQKANKVLCIHDKKLYIGK